MTDRPKRRSRRVIVPAPDGVDPRPGDHVLAGDASEDRPEGWGDAAPSDDRASQDEQLRRDRPPHWG